MMNNQKILKERKQFSLFDEVKNTKNRDEIIQRYQLSENPFIFSEDDFIPTPFDEVDKKFLDPSNDFNTAKHLFEILKIDRIQASDQRLWTTLTHTVGWEYMQGRWNIRDTRKNTDLKLNDRTLYRAKSTILFPPSKKQKQELEIQKDTTFQMILLRQKMKRL